MSRPRLIAHRGYASRFPENSLQALAAAHDAGARYLEIDVQLGRDGVPIVIHDTKLGRTTGRAGTVFERTAAELQAIGVPALTRAAEAIAAWPEVHAFVEIKRESLEGFGVAPTVSAVLDAMRPIAKRAAVISFDRAAIEQARDDGGFSIGWVLDRYDAATIRDAETIAPDYLFVDKRKLPVTAARLPEGVWEWAVYEVTDPEEALALAARGVRFVETMAIGELIADPRLAPTGEDADGEGA